MTKEKTQYIMDLLSRIKNKEDLKFIEDMVLELTKKARDQINP